MIKPKLSISWKKHCDLVKTLLVFKFLTSFQLFSAQKCFSHLKCTAAAKSLQSRPTLCDPIDCSLPGSPIHGIIQARVLEWGAIAFSVKGPYADTNSFASGPEPLFLSSQNISSCAKKNLIQDLKIMTIKKTEGQRIGAFELWCWRRLLRVPWTEGDPTSPP